MELLHKTCGKKARQLENSHINEKNHSFSQKAGKPSSSKFSVYTTGVIYFCGKILENSRKKMRNVHISSSIETRVSLTCFFPSSLYVCWRWQWWWWWIVMVVFMVVTMMCWGQSVSRESTFMCLFYITSSRGPFYTLRDLPYILRPPFHMTALAACMSSLQVCLIQATSKPQE